MLSIPQYFRMGPLLFPISIKRQLMTHKGTCPWCLSHPDYIAYHDEEWGVPEYDDRALWEKLLLDGAQAGLSWWTILQKRENYRRAFDRFDPEKVARYDHQKVQELLQNPGIVRNKLKVNAAVTNAQAYLDILERGISFRDYLWKYVEGKPLINYFKELSDVPAFTEVSTAMSKELKKDGFKFVGSTIVYAFMQATGMVNDHLTGCPRHPDNL